VLGLLAGLGFLVWGPALGRRRWARWLILSFCGTMQHGSLGQLAGELRI